METDNIFIIETIDPHATHVEARLLARAVYWVDWLPLQDTTLQEVFSQIRFVVRLLSC